MGGGKGSGQWKGKRGVGRVVQGGKEVEMSLEMEGGMVSGKGSEKLKWK